MPDWIPDNLATLVVFKPIRIVLLIIAAFVLRRVLHRLINRSVRRAVDRPLYLAQSNGPEIDRRHHAVGRTS